jgi:LPS export ABC transporter protein LptC
MIWRLLFTMLALGALGGLLYLQQPDSNAGDSSASDYSPTEPGFAALHAQLIETGEDGHALYRLDADRIDQPMPQGTIFLTTPRLDYQPESGQHWTVTAERGQLPQSADWADLFGDVHAQGKPADSDLPVRIDTEQLHLNMLDEVATSNVKVRVDWAGNALRGRGMHADLKNDRLQLAGDVSGVLRH